MAKGISLEDEQMKDHNPSNIYVAKGIIPEDKDMKGLNPKYLGLKDQQENCSPKYIEHSNPKIRPIYVRILRNSEKKERRPTYADVLKHGKSTYTGVQYKKIEPQ